MKIQEYYSSIIRRGTRNVPTFGEARRDLAQTTLDARYFIQF